MTQAPLRRYPARARELLQAWDGADTLLLEHLREAVPPDRRIALLGDSFGALTRGLAGRDFTTYTDSYVSARAIALNTGVTSVHELHDLTGSFDVALLRIPKSMAFLEDQLAALSRGLRPGAAVVGGAMLKHLPKASFALLEKYIGPTRTSLAARKARLVFAEFTRAPAPSPFPTQTLLDGFPEPFVHFAHVFSRERLDSGTRLLLENLPEEYGAVGAGGSGGAPKPGGSAEPVLLDLGCGNGALAIAAKIRQPGVRLVFADDSAQAIRSAEANFARYFPTARAAFHWTNGFEDGAPASVDTVLCNPPFHQGTTLTDAVAEQMFRDAHRVLRPGGRLRIVGNRHLGYPERLRRVFSRGERRVAVIAENAKFVVCEAIR